MPRRGIALSAYPASVLAADGFHDVPKPYINKVAPIGMLERRCRRGKIHAFLQGKVVPQSIDQPSGITVTHAQTIYNIRYVEYAADEISLLLSTAKNAAPKILIGIFAFAQACRHIF